MDTEVFPVTLDYWGPSSRIFFLNIQLRYTPVYTDKERFAIAFERPGATADGTDYSNSVDIQQCETPVTVTKSRNTLQAQLEMGLYTNRQPLQNILNGKTYLLPRCTI